MFLLLLQLLLVVSIASAYDIGLCKEYYNEGSERGGTNPVSIPFNYLTNNHPSRDEIFNGNFLIKPYNFGKQWISFKPNGDYSVGEEYQVSFDNEQIEIGLVDDIRYRQRLEAGNSWVYVKIVIKKDGNVQVSLYHNQQFAVHTFRLPEILTDRPLFLEFKGPDHRNEEILVFYDCKEFDSKVSVAPPLGEASTSSVEGAKRQQEVCNVLIDGNGYDVKKCGYYNFKSVKGSKPCSIPLNTLRNNKASLNEIFRGSFVVNPEKYRTIWISFKPIEQYARGEEFRIAIHPKIMVAGSIRGADEGAKVFFPKDIKGWVSVEIIVKIDGNAEVRVDGVAETLRYKFTDIISNIPNFVELKGFDSENDELTVFYDCSSFLRKQDN